MELNDEILIRAPREAVFAALTDAEILQASIPGCEELEALSDTEFSATVSAKVGPLKTRFKGQARMDDIVAPESYSLSGEGRGGPAGHAKVRASVKLAEQGPATRLSYDVNADIGGKLAQLGGALVQSTAKKLAQEFFNNLENAIGVDAEADGDVEASNSGEGAAPAQVVPPAVVWIAAAIVLALAAAWII